MAATPDPKHSRTPDSTDEARQSGDARNRAGQNAGGARKKAGKAAVNKAAARKGLGDVTAAKDVLKGRNADGSEAGGIKQVSKGAKVGAQIGSKITPGAGTVVGGAIGAGVGALASKKVRRRIIVTICAIPVLFVGSLFMVVSSLTGGTDGFDTNARANAGEAAQTDGVPVRTMTAIDEATHGTDTPWELVAAIAYKRSDGQVPDFGDLELDPAPSSSGEAGEPYGMDLAEANAVAEDLGIEALDDDQAANIEDQTRFVATLISRGANDAAPDAVPDLDAGAALVDAADGAGQVRRIGTGESNEKAAEQVRDIYMSALDDLDDALEPVGEDAEGIYDLALQWRLGVSVCSNSDDEGTTQARAVAGDWTAPMKGRLTSPFGPRMHPITGVQKLHDGQDIANGGGTPIHAAAAGTVKVAGMQPAWGVNVLIEHGGGIVSRYAHMAMGSLKVSAGETVSAGQQLGVEGSTGFSTGAHLHFSIYDDGKPIDPLSFMKERGVELGSDAPGKPDGDGTATEASASSTSTSKSPRSLRSKNGEGEQVTFDSAQMDIAKTLVDVGTQVANEKAVVIALMVGLQESRLENLNYGDRDSVGVFQQRPSTGWGTRAQIMDVPRSTKAFYGGPKGPHRGEPPGLLDVDGWASMALGEAGQAAQRSGHPTAYDKWEPVAKDLYKALRGTTLPTNDSTGCPSIEDDKTAEVKMATYNVCLTGCDDNLDPADERIPQLAETMRNSGADIIAVQNTGEEDQAKALADEISDSYSVASQGHSQAIFVNPAAFSAAGDNGKALPGKTFGIGGGRYGIAQILRDLRTGEKLIVTTLHPQGGSTAVDEGRRLDQVRVAERTVGQLRRDHPGTPTLYAGSFNTGFPGTGAQTRVADFYDSKGFTSAEQQTKNRTNDQFDSVNDAGSFPENSRRADHVLADGAKTPVKEWGQELPEDREGPVPSNHNLVWAQMSLSDDVGGGSVSSQPCKAGSEVEKGLQQHTVDVYRAVCNQFPDVATYYGLANRGEHATGHSLDVMVSGAEGRKIRDFLQKNHAKLGIDYLIYEQEIWSVQRDSEGWRPMGSRGSPTADHFDHVHVTVKG
ncbi:peptidoglycan DD-metalloendopeptidase family protein [Aeromicrobium sp. CTD01-1L150]|uniref:peptidoglycan DD-metalloendopeptidase family protein n=1 Tax=Aeromicrobium sp. CTD01-1L150 TaxID=3341830 RepID=UPI0035C18DD7